MMCNLLAQLSYNLTTVKNYRKARVMEFAATKGQVRQQAVPENIICHMQKKPRPAALQARHVANNLQCRLERDYARLQVFNRHWHS